MLASNTGLGMLAYNTGLGQMSQAQATAYVTSLYQTYLGRAPDSGGLQDWVNALTTGKETEAEEVTGFTSSAEYLADKAKGLIDPQGFFQQPSQPSSPTTVSPSAPSVNAPATTSTTATQPVPNGAILSPTTYSFTASLGLPDLSILGLSSDEVYLGIAGIAVVLILMGGRR